MRVTKHTFWNYVEARSTREIADYGFSNVEIASLPGVEPIAGSAYEVTDAARAVSDAVRRYESRSVWQRRPVAA